MRALVWMIAALALAAGEAQAASKRGLSEARESEAGQRFARRACAGCHAIAVRGGSPNPLAPPFRTIPQSLPGRRLPAQLRAISAHGHVAMPPIYMTPSERRAVAAYIRAVAARAPRRQT